MKRTTVPVQNDRPLPAWFALLGAVMLFGTPDLRAATFQVLDQFDSRPGELTVAADGTIYGVTSAFLQNKATVFRVETDGTAATLYTFGTETGPTARLAEGPGNALYGVTATSGINDSGRIFKVDRTTGELTTIHSFNQGTGDHAAHPEGGVTLHSSGFLYGVTVSGGTLGAGTIYKLSPDGTGFTTIYNFQGGPFGQASAGNPLIVGGDGNLYGTTKFGFAGFGKTQAVAFRITPDGTYTVLHAFTDAEGAWPDGPLAPGDAGAFFGVVNEGGNIKLDGNPEGGNVFKMGPDGKVTLLRDFHKESVYPVGGLIRMPDGSFIGVAGISSDDPVTGMVFRVGTDGKVESIYNIRPDDGYPDGGLVRGNDGFLYGTMQAGSGGGTLYRIDPANHTPQPQDDTFVSAAASMKVPVLTNDTDPDRDLLAITGVTQGAAGKVVFTAKGLTYTPGKNFTGSDTFNYTVSDGEGGSATATVTVRNPFVPLTSNYAALIAPGTSSLRGLVNVTLTKTGAFSGKLRLFGKKTSFRGTFGLDGKAEVSVRGLTAGSSILLKLHSDLEGSDPISITLDDLANPAVTVSLAGTPAYTKAAPSPLAGLYTALMPPAAATAGSTAFPQGFGHATMKVAPTGAITITGQLGDGTAFSAASAAAIDGKFLLYAGLYAPGQGSLSGEVQFRDVADVSDCDGALEWIKPTPAQPRGTYPNGFETSTIFSGARYTPPANGSFVLPVGQPPGNAVFDATGGNLAAPLHKALSISSANRVTVDQKDSDKLALSLQAPNGTFRGSFTDVAAGKKRSFGGVILLKQKRAAGVFTGSDQSGAVELTLP